MGSLILEVPLPDIQPQSLVDLHVRLRLLQLGFYRFRTGCGYIVRCLEQEVMVTQSLPASQCQPVLFVEEKP